GFACLSQLTETGVYSRLNQLTSLLTEGLANAAKKYNVPLVVNRAGAMFGLFFTDRAEVTTYEDVMSSDVELFKKFFHYMLNNGVYFAPSAFEAGFISLAHSEQDIEKTVAAAERFFAMQ
ncbi:aminotransferase class III-fold pyridoxal phosphate-dependent enzyme, partial [Candidatus Schmidhempelia bombi str. Bimp]